ncbi:NeuD/PglB/VioB family sugar acetyltransferase [Fodinibius halophilus]|uniref:Hexapeptide transferase n=1 Tax=Fodinibius halophilus TaxID=1736908 RepID=A0A6M1TDR6_9BACT|nr:NeuD/PglB/VioB family sugar acetyltransferase [Fodinibius halophilus]NGP88322.1 hexapeptide transferase [Fodinibius halophilus]
MSNAKQSVVIIGGGGHANVVASIIERSQYYSCGGYTDLSDKGTICNCNYLGDDEKIIDDKENSYNLVIGISYVNSVTDGVRDGLIKKMTQYSHFNFPIITSDVAFIDTDVSINKGTVVINGATINTGVELGEFCVVNTNATIDHNCKLGNNVQVGPGATVCGDVEIGDDVFIGAGATIIDGLEICEDVIIGAGSVVTKSITEPGIYKGIPSSLSNQMNS